MASGHIQIDDDLVVRVATADDAEGVVELNRLVHGDPEKNKPGDEVAIWTADLFAGYNDAIRPSLIVVPIDYRENAILTRRLGEITMGL